MPVLCTNMQTQIHEHIQIFSTHTFTYRRLKGGVDARVIEEDGKWLVLDANHELAGE